MEPRGRCEEERLHAREREGEEGPGLTFGGREQDKVILEGSKGGAEMTE